MISREKWLEGIRDEVIRLQMARVYDLMTQCVRQHRRAVTDFLSPVVQDLCAQKLQSEKHGPRADFVGGHPGYEACVIVFNPEDRRENDPEAEALPLVLLEVSSLAEALECSHRDLLGSLLGLGLSRDKFGDLRIGKGAAYVFVTRKVAPVILNGLIRVSRDAVTVREVPWSAFPVEEAGGELVVRSVAALRLDAVIAAGFDLSRSQAQKLIESDRVKLNHRPQTRPDKGVPEEALISVRGYGRLRLVANLGKSRKDRSRVQIIRYR